MTLYGAPALPLRFTGGAGEMQYGDALIEQSILTILGTSLGERTMRPDFGSRLAQLVFENPGPMRDALAAIWTRDALQRWEPRITVLDVQCRDVEKGLLVTVTYTVNATQQQATTQVNIPKPEGVESYAQ